MAGILGVFLTIHWISSNSLLKEESRANRELLNKMEQRL